MGFLSFIGFLGLLIRETRGGVLGCPWRGGWGDQGCECDREGAESADVRGGFASICFLQWLAQTYSFDFLFFPSAPSLINVAIALSY